MKTVNTFSVVTNVKQRCQGVVHLQNPILLQTYFSTYLWSTQRYTNSTSKEREELRHPKKHKRERYNNHHSRRHAEEWTKIWDINDPGAQRITRKVGEMIAIDCHLLSVAEYVGLNWVLKALEPRYNCPSRKYITDCVIPKIFGGMKEEVSKLLHSDEPVISLTMIFGAVVQMIYPYWAWLFIG